MSTKARFRGCRGRRSITLLLRRRFLAVLWGISLGLCSGTADSVPRSWALEGPSPKPVAGRAAASASLSLLSQPCGAAKLLDDWFQYFLLPSSGLKYDGAYLCIDLEGCRFLLHPTIKMASKHCSADLSVLWQLASSSASNAAYSIAEVTSQRHLCCFAPDGA